MPKNNHEIAALPIAKSPLWYTLVMPARKPISDGLWVAIRDDGRTQKELARRARIDPANVSKFMCGTQGISLTGLDRLARVLDLELIPRERSTK